MYSTELTSRLMRTCDTHILPTHSHLRLSVPSFNTKLFVSIPDIRMRPGTLHPKFPKRSAHHATMLSFSPNIPRVKICTCPGKHIHAREIHGHPSRNAGSRPIRMVVDQIWIPGFEGLR